MSEKRKTIDELLALGIDDLRETVDSQAHDLIYANERIAELEAQQSRYDALEDAVDKAQAWALDIHLGNREALQGKAAEIYAVCFLARNDKEALDEHAT